MPYAILDKNRRYPIFINAKEMQDYFDRANALMKDNPPTQADAPMVAELAKINVGPGFRFDSSVFGLGANPVSIAVYPKTDIDIDGNRLNDRSDVVFNEDGSLDIYSS